MMRLLYLSRLVFDSDKANVYNTVRTCAALASAGISVVLVSSNNGAHGEKGREFLAKRGISDAFQIVSLDGASNRFGPGMPSRNSKLEALLANWEVALELWRRRKEVDVTYLRDPYLLPAALFARFVAGKPVFFEAHAVLVGRRNVFLGNMTARISRGVIAITHALADYYKKYNSNVIVSYCAAGEPERFAVVREGPRELRGQLKLPQNAFLLCYTGNVGRTGNGDSYGVEDIIEALPLMSPEVEFVAVGERNLEETSGLRALAAEKDVAQRVHLLPWVSKAEVARYLLASDILLIPAAGARIGNAPTKIFDYLISGRPIVAADTIPMREVLADRETALLVDYKKPESWASAVEELRRDRNMAHALVERAKEVGAQYTWENRGKEIATFLSHSFKS